MKIFRYFLFAAVLLLAGALQAQSPVRYNAESGAGKIRIDGTSTVHDWTIETAAVGGFMELDPAFDADLKTLTTTPKAEIIVPVRQLKSNPNHPNMDKVMLEHLHATNSPVVKYSLLKLTPKAGAPSQFDAQGALTIAGVTRTNIMPITMQRIDKTKIKVKGNTALKMTDYGVQPPAPRILGIPTIKTGDEVKLTFEWTGAQPDGK